MAESKVKGKFKAPEGRYQLLCERSYGVLPFNYQRSTKLSLGRLEGGEDAGSWLIYNVGEFVYIARADSTKTVSLPSPQSPCAAEIEMCVR